MFKFFIFTASFDVFGGKIRSQFGQFIFKKRQVINAEYENIHYNFLKYTAI